MQQLEIPQAAMDQLRARRGRMRGEVVLLHQQYVEAAPGGIARDADAVDASADDDEVIGRNPDRRILHVRCASTARAMRLLTRALDSSVTPATCGVRIRFGMPANESPVPASSGSRSN